MPPTGSSSSTAERPGLEVARRRASTRRARTELAGASLHQRAPQSGCSCCGLCSCRACSAFSSRKGATRFGPLLVTLVDARKGGPSEGSAFRARRSPRRRPWRAGWPPKLAPAQSGSRVGTHSVRRRSRTSVKTNRIGPSLCASLEPFGADEKCNNYASIIEALATNRAQPRLWGKNSQPGLRAGTPSYLAAPNGPAGWPCNRARRTKRG